MSKKQGVAALAGAAIGVAAGLVAQRAAVNRRRRDDPEGGEDFGERRGERSHLLELPDGANLFVEEVGPANDRKGVVFLHGSALRTDLWHYQMAGIDDRRLIFYDLRGHGRSQPKGEAEFSIEVLSEDLSAVIEDAGLDEVVIVGHSIGGMVALELCSSHPDLLSTTIKGVVLANTTHRPA